MNKINKSSMIELIFNEIEVDLDEDPPVDKFIEETEERLKKLKYDKEIKGKFTNFLKNIEKIN